MTKKETLQIAKNAYQVVRAFEASSNKVKISKIPTFNKLSDIQKDHLCKAVEMLKSNERMYASSIHDSWINNMIANGWTYGEEFSEESKTHPDMIDYRSLPPLQRAKDKLFNETVRLGHVKPIKNKKTFIEKILDRFNLY